MKSATKQRESRWRSLKASAIYFALVFAPFPFCIRFGFYLSFRASACALLS